MLERTHPSWIEIDLLQFRKNLSILRSHIGNTLFCLPVKANAYGHGLCQIGKEAENCGVDYLAVAHLKEGIELRQAKIQLPILVLGAIHKEQVPELLDFDLEISISSKFKADLVAEQCKKISKKCPVHLEIDTGMQRTGVQIATAPSLFDYMEKLGCFHIVGIYSHFASANHPNDSLAHYQLEKFRSLIETPPFQGKPLLKHLANSSGTLFFKEAHLDMVRPSIVSFGYLPKNAPSFFQEIKPCFSLKTKVSYFKIVEADMGISYGHSYVTPRRTRIVTIPIGYGDGYRRALSNKASVLIRGKMFPIVGTICMDQCMVDIGDSEVHVGDEVVLIGKQGDKEILLEDLALACDTISYELLCLFSQRLPRIYVR